MATATGSTEATEQPKKRRWTKNGWVTVRTFKGPLAAIEAKAEELRLDVNPPESFEHNTAALATLTANYPESETPEDDDDTAEENAVWELIPVELRKDISNHDTFLSANAATQKAMAQIEVDKYQGENIKEKDYDALFSTSGNTANLYRDMRHAHIESYIEFSYNVRQTIVVNTAGELQAVFDDVGAVVDPPEPNEFAKFDLDELEDFEFLKRAPAVHHLGGNRFRITQEWHGVPNDGKHGWSQTFYTDGTGEP